MQALSPLTLPAYFHTPFLSPIHFTLKMESTLPSETASPHISTWCHNPEDHMN